MNILFLGDVIGSPGCHMVEKHLPRLLEEYQIDFTIANGENSAGGAGMSRKSYQQLQAAGVDAFTMGNHTWDNKDLQRFIDQCPCIVRPANYPPGVPGRPWQIFTVGKEKLAVGNLIGRVYMTPMDCPFAAANRMLEEVSPQTPFIVIDFHAEATSEKMAMGWYLDGRISTIVGTHTHIQTNDARILPHGTAYLTDLGMTGPRDSILGVDKDIIIRKMLNQMPARFEVARGDLQLNGLVVELGPDGRAQSMELINFYEPCL